VCRRSIAPEKREKGGKENTKRARPRPRWRKKQRREDKKRINRVSQTTLAGSFLVKGRKEQRGKKDHSKKIKRDLGRKLKGKRHALSKTEGDSIACLHTTTANKGVLKKRNAKRRREMTLQDREEYQLRIASSENRIAERRKCSLFGERSRPLENAIKRRYYRSRWGANLGCSSAKARGKKKKEKNRMSSVYSHASLISGGQRKKQRGPRGGRLRSWERRLDERKRIGSGAGSGGGERYRKPDTRKRDEKKQ